MYHIGDKVLHLSEGACYVEDCITMSHQGTNRKYLKLSPILNSHATLFIPAEQEPSTKVRTRPVLTELEIEEAENQARTTDIPWIENDKKRQQELLETIRTGDFLQNAKLLKMMFHKNSQRSLGNRDKELLHNAQKLVGSELAIIRNKSYDSVLSEFYAMLFPDE